MSPRRKLSILNRGQALAWLNHGVSMREVAEHLQMGHSVIQGLQERVRATRTAARFVTTACFVTTARFVTNDLATNRAATVPFCFKIQDYFIISSEK